MDNNYQRTLAGEAACSGVGIHLGKKATVKIKPAPADQGIWFARVDLGPKALIPARSGSVFSTARGTHLAKGKASVHTVEHLLASLSGLGVDNALVEISGPEVPVLDGSAEPWCRLIQKAGLKVLPGHLRRTLVLKRSVLLTRGEGSLLAMPCNRLILSTVIGYKHPYLLQQTVSVEVSPSNFPHQLARARTFGFAEEVEVLRKRGLGLGGSYKNALVIGPKGILHNTLRYPDEFARHKALDLLGDLALLGRPLQAHVIAVKSGHTSHVALVKKLEKLF